MCLKNEHRGVACCSHRTPLTGQWARICAVMGGWSVVGVTPCLPPGFGAESQRDLFDDSVRVDVRGLLAAEPFCPSEESYGHQEDTDHSTNRPPERIVKANCLAIKKGLFPVQQKTRRGFSKPQMVV